MKIINVTWESNQHLRMISRGSSAHWKVEEWPLKIQLCITGINDFLNYSSSYLTSWFCSSRLWVDQFCEVWPSWCWFEDVSRELISVDPLWSAVWLVKGRFCRRKKGMKEKQIYHYTLTNSMSICIIRYKTQITSSTEVWDHKENLRFLLFKPRKNKF